MRVRVIPMSCDRTRVELRGFEPLTPSMRTRCATGLRYSPRNSRQRSKRRALPAPSRAIHDCMLRHPPGATAMPGPAPRRAGDRPRAARGKSAPTLAGQAPLGDWPYLPCKARSIRSPSFLLPACHSARQAAAGSPAPSPALQCAVEPICGSFISCSPQRFEGLLEQVA